VLAEVCRSVLAPAQVVLAVQCRCLLEARLLPTVLVVGWYCQAALVAPTAVSSSCRAALAQQAVQALSASRAAQHQVQVQRAAVYLCAAVTATDAVAAWLSQAEVALAEAVLAAVCPS
jgi:hypothetical protein